MKKEKLFMLILVIVLVFGGAYKLYDELTKDNSIDVAGQKHRQCRPRILPFIIKTEKK